MCISMNLLQFFCSQQNFTFVMSSFEGATWPTSHRSNLFMLGSYPCVPLNVLQNQGLLKIFNISDFFPNLSWKVFYFTLFCCFFIQILLFYRFPNVIVSVITRGSVRRAFLKGITARQVRSGYISRRMMEYFYWNRCKCRCVI